MPRGADLSVACSSVVAWSARVDAATSRAEAEPWQGHPRAVEIKREGNQLTILDGRKKTVRKFVTPEQAAIAHEKLLEEHQRELAARRAAPRVDPRHPELEQQITNAPEERDGYAVLADWLESQGDPRGRLIAMQLAGQSVAQEITANRKYFLGPLAQYQRLCAFHWEHGFIQRASINADEETRVELVLEELLKHPSGRFLIDVRLDADEQDLQPAVDLLVRAARPTIRSLTLVASRVGVDIQPLLATAPLLRELSLCRVHCPVLALPALTSLRIVRGRLPSSIGDAKLRRLDLVDVESDELALLSAIDTSQIERLEIGGSQDIGHVCRELPDMPRLDWLVFSYNRMTDDDALALEQRRGGRPRLTMMNAYGNNLTAKGLAALRRIAGELYA
jgi:uncharacterized protein (TIGR02996 family)